MRYLPFVEEFNSSIQVNETFPLASLLPPVEDMERFYTYKGSLTTPPCSEAVIWILFPKTMPVSISQVRQLGILLIFYDVVDYINVTKLTR